MNIDIGPITYKIVVVPDLRGDNDKKLFGEVVHGLCEIRLEGNNAPQQGRQTLWHEIVHVILTQLGRQDEGSDEPLVDGLAYAFMQVVQDNKWLAEEVT